MPSQEQLDRLKAVVPLAQATQRRWHVPASVTLAQWIFESSWGTSKLSLQCNNCFGIKHRAQDRNEAYGEFKTAEFSSPDARAHMETAQFASYASVSGSFEAHGRLLGSTTRYQRAIAVADDVPAFCRLLQSCGYSTNPRYAKMLCDEIDALNLTQYDTLPAAEPPIKDFA